ncbi:MAG: hypothetical protein L6Q75_03905 [Burkholderiaceae bacterium]|nr:hypothetical protein [Burkholderiaceae bacterium]
MKIMLICREQGMLIGKSRALQSYLIRFRRALVLMLSVTTAGCIPLYKAQRTDTPSSWMPSAKVLSNGCPDISGTYGNDGVSAPSESTHFQIDSPNLSIQICGEYSERPECLSGERYIRIHQPTEDEFTFQPISAEGDGQRLGGISSFKLGKDYRCAGGKVIFSKTRKYLGEMSDYNIVTDETEVSKLLNGDLFLTFRHIQSGIMLVFVGRTVEEVKMRFPLLAK